MVYWARENQTLAEHVAHTANLAKRFATVFGCGEAVYSAGLLHDLGKYTQVWQDYLDRRLKGDAATRGEVIHAWQGAKHIAETVKDLVLADILGGIIAAHHGGLADAITDGERTLPLKIGKYESDFHYDEAVATFTRENGGEVVGSEDLPARLSSVAATAKDEILGVCKISAEKKLPPFFILHLLTKALYSCIVDADRCDAAGINPDDAPPDWTPLIQCLEKHLANFSGEKPLNNVRKRTSEQCAQAGKRSQGVYTLSVPTGGGKTLSSLRFALEHARMHDLKRIIYVIPYLSILDQTAKTIRDVFGDENGNLILEHHSNIELPESDGENDRHKLLTSRWDSPIILTTMVQFLETIYSNKASKLRKFHNMSESVLIFDEIQALPIKCVHLFNDAVNFLHVFGKSTVLLCTATQPHLDKVERPVRLSADPALVSFTPEEMKAFERVCPEDKTQPPMSYGQIAGLAKAQMDAGKSVLVVLNTKADARGVYAQCKAMELSCEKAFLTTDLCPAHRMAVLDRLRDSLAAERPTLCVSTQLIEAGVDISFGCVIRAEAGLDSIVQAAGRCNRNNEYPEAPQTVFIVDVQDGNLTCLPEIADGKAVTARIIRENGASVLGAAVSSRRGENLLGEDALNCFYRYYFYAQKDKMDYTVKDGKATVYSLLNDNPLGTQAYKDRHDNTPYKGLPSAFRTAAEAFFVIEGGQTGIVVPYDGAIELVAAFQKAFNPAEKIRILKRLQKYTVNVHFPALSKLSGAGAIRAVDDTFYLLSSDWYDSDEQGLLP